MNLIIVVAFLLFIGSIVVLIFPKQCALRLGLINKYDMETLPFKYIIRLVLMSIIVMFGSIFLLVYEIDTMNYGTIDWSFLETIFG